MRQGAGHRAQDDCRSNLNTARHHAARDTNTLTFFSSADARFSTQCCLHAAATEARARAAGGRSAHPEPMLPLSCSCAVRSSTCAAGLLQTFLGAPCSLVPVPGRPHVHRTAPARAPRASRTLIPRYTPPRPPLSPSFSCAAAPLAPPHLFSRSQKRKN